MERGVKRKSPRDIANAIGTRQLHGTRSSPYASTFSARRRHFRLIGSFPFG